jgi:Tfp pilus assembly protein PilF
VDALRKSLAVDARDERAYYALANAYRRMGEAKNAAAAEARFRRISALHVRMQDLEARLGHNPNSAVAHLNLARVYRDLGLAAQAVRHYDAALHLNPASVEARREGQRLARDFTPDPNLSPARDFSLPSPAPAP